MAGITSSVHFTILSVGEQLRSYSLLFSFEWPSVAYSLDILAWDWFFALSMFFAAPVFSVGRLEKIIRTLMVISGMLSLVGLAGVVLADMQIRNIGILGYAVIAPIVFLLLGILFGQPQNERKIPSGAGQ
jgi:hypothetical protein